VSAHAWSRRDIARLLAFGGSAALIPRPAWPSTGSLQSQDDSEAYWARVRQEFLMPPDLAMFNAANLCPSSRRVVDVLERTSREIDRDPSPANRAQLGPGREQARRAIAEALRASPDDIVITRNTSEANNLVSSGLSLGAGDEVLIFADNHPSNHAAWTEKSKRAGFTVTTLPQPNPHPGADYYLDAVRAAITPRTRVLTFTHVTSTVGDLMPAAELCRLAREREVLSLVDGAQSFGVLDVDVAAMQPDFYTGSAHKWPCGARETGVLFVGRAAQARLAPSIISLYGGATGVSRRLEAHGQRDEAAMIAFGEAMRLQQEIGRARIEARARALAAALAEGLRQLPGVRVWTSPERDRAAAIVSVQPASLDPRRLMTRLYEQDRVVCALRGGSDRGGLRFSPHFYNSMAEIERTVAAIRKYLAAGI
jgi:selenocysteine lyase/cysteine desulfurase